MKNFLLAAVAAAIAAAAPASAKNVTSAIAGLYNTGVDAANVSVVGVGDPDLHWTLGGGTAYVSGQNGVYPIGAWLAEDSTSRWLTPSPVAGATFDPTTDGTYRYNLSFSLSGYKHRSAVILGRFSADDETLVMLNGRTINGSVAGFTSWTDFDSIGGKFRPGVNNLTFVVSNFAQASSNPTGLRVELSGTAKLRGAPRVPEPESWAPLLSAPGVPEPQAWALLIIGFGFVGIAARRKAGVAVVAA